MKFLISLLICALFVFVLNVSPALADREEMQDMILGALAGTIVHEAAHHFGAGKDSIDWHGPIFKLRWEYKDKPYTYTTIERNGHKYRVYYDYNHYRNNLEGIAKTGMISEGIISHYLNSRNFQNKRLRNLRKGFVLRNILNNIYNLSVSRDRGDMDPENFRDEGSRKTFKRIIAIDTGLLLYEFITHKSLLPRGVGISFNKKRVMLKKTWKF